MAGAPSTCLVLIPQGGDAPSEASTRPVYPRLADVVTLYIVESYLMNIGNERFRNLTHIV